MTEPSSNQVEAPQLIIKNAKASLVSLKEALGTKDAWDRDVEFHRRDARRQFLHLIFDFPYSPQTLSLDNPIWLETSHACIQAYRQRLATLDKAIADKTTKPPASNNDENVNTAAPGRGRRSETGPVVEHRKVLQRFRQFLAEEEKFFTAFILRLVRSFALNEALPTLDALQLSRTSDDPSLRKATFPEEQPPLEPPPNQREKKIITVVKAIISLGDLARYKEQYNERQGRPKAGAEEALPRWATKANRRAGETVPRPRNYARASACYTQARLLFPDGGQAFHQLAILSSYQSDTFAGLLYYYRSLCVRVPFNMAFDNLVKTLDKIYITWNNEGGVKAIGAIASNEDDAPKAIVDRFKKDVVTLHAIWRTERATEIELRLQAEHTLARFNKLLAERLLPIGLVIKIYVAAIGSLWAFQKHLKRAPKHIKSPTSQFLDKESNLQRESVVLTHVMELHLGLVKLAITQLNPDTIQNGATPAEKITAVLRRILQSLRVASRWVTVSLDYLYQSTNPTSDSNSQGAASSGLTCALGEFWSSYAVFITALGKTFPARDLQVGNISVEEDIEFATFTPLKGSLKPSENAIPLNQVHPNDEYLLRIRDILADAAILVKSDITPLNLKEGVYVSSTEVFTPIAVTVPGTTPTGTTEKKALAGRSNEKMRGAEVARFATSELVETPTTGHIPPKGPFSPTSVEAEDRGITGGEDDDVASVSTEDPVTMAMRATLNVSDEEDEFGDADEEILYPHQQGTWNAVEPRYDIMNTPSSSRPPIPPAAFRQAPVPLHDPSTFFPQMASHQDVFAPTSAPFGNISPQFPQPYYPDQNSAHYQEQTPTRYYSEHSFHRLGPNVPSASPIRQGHHPTFSASAGVGYPAGHIGSPSSSMSMNMSAITGPRVPPRSFSGSFSAGGNIGPGSGSTTPPRTAQDLLMRVLGGGGAPQSSPQAITTNASINALGNQNLSRPRLSQSPPRGSATLAENQTPLFFGTTGGNSIWAP